MIDAVYSIVAGGSKMLACYAWSNLHLINITNTKINLYAEEKADLFVRVGPHISKKLIKSIEASGVFQHVYCFDPLNIIVFKERYGKIRGLRILALKRATTFAYASLLERLCGDQEYSRILLPWFFADCVYLIRYWAMHSEQLSISFVEEGTSSYYYTKKQMCYSLFNAPTPRAKLKRFLMEGKLMRQFSKWVDTICLYRPEYCSDDITYNKLAIPPIREDINPIMHQILIQSVGNLDDTHFMRYEKKNLYYFASYSLGDPSFERQSEHFLENIIQSSRAQNVICKVHTHASSHAEKFAKELESLIFVDRERYIFEGLYAQLPNKDRKVIVSCVSTTAMNPKFMFGEEPYVIFTYRLYDGYRQRPVKSDDLLSGILLDAYKNKSRIMIPNSEYELESMVRRAYRAVNQLN